MKQSTLKIPHTGNLWKWMGWLMKHYEYTTDEKFLKKRAFPAIQEIARFNSDWLTEDPRDGTLISVPSTSPENQFINEKGDSVSTCLGSAMDQ